VVQDIVKKEILKILSEKSKCSKENEQLKKALMNPDTRCQFNKDLYKCGLQWSNVAAVTVILD
jgi:hypothetical protein